MKKSLGTNALLQKYLSYIKYKIKLLAKYENIIRGSLMLKTQKSIS